MYILIELYCFLYGHVLNKVLLLLNIGTLIACDTLQNKTVDNNHVHHRYYV